MLGSLDDPSKIGAGMAVAMVTTFYGVELRWVKGALPFFKGFLAWAARRSDRVSAISNYLRDRTVKEFDIKNHIQVIYNFVNCELYRRDPEWAKRRSDYGSSNEKILVHLSNFRPVKRLTDVVEIFDRVHKKIPSKLLLIGDGPDRSRAEWLAVQKGIHEHVLFLGKQDRVHEKLAVADIMLLPSELESFGLAALEAMACEVTPIATRVGGIPEVIEHGKSGYLADVGDVDTMANYAIELLSDDKRLAQMGKQARFEAESRFCSSEIIPQYEQFYRRVLERSS